MTLIWFQAGELRGRGLWDAELVLCCVPCRSMISYSFRWKNQHNNLSLFSPMGSSAWFSSARFLSHVSNVKSRCKYDFVCRECDQLLCLEEGSPKEPLFVIHTSLLHIKGYYASSKQCLWKRFWLGCSSFIVGVYPEARLRDDDI